MSSRIKPSDSAKPNTAELTELVLARCIGAFALVLIALALPDLLQGDGPHMSLDYAVFVFMIPSLTVAAMIPRKRGDVRRIFAGGAALMILAGFLLWHLAVIGNGLSADARPWSWGIAGAGIGLASVARNNRLAGIYGAVFAVLVLLIPLMPAGSMRSWAESWQDALLTVAMTAVIVAPIWALRLAVQESDRFAVEAVEKFAEVARFEAVRKEKRRIDALTHDIILSTLIVASQARTQVVQDAAGRAAIDALAQLEGLKHDAGALQGASVTVGDWLIGLGSAVAACGATLQMGGAKCPQTALIPLEVAQALTQAANEAVRNSARHAPGARIELRPSFPGHEPSAHGAAAVVLEIEDNGPGFDPETPQTERMGVAASIVGRMRDVQGGASVESRPGAGTLVRLHWPRGGAGHGSEN